MCKYTAGGSSSTNEGDVGEIDDVDSDSDADNDRSKREYVSKSFALVFGLFCGAIPDVLAKLNSTERSLVSQINVITRVNVHTKYDHSKMKPFSTVNNLEATVSQLPNLAALADVAYIRSTNADNKVLYGYRPHAVVAAIRWLIANNRVYKDVELLLNDSWRTMGENEFTTDGLTDVVVDDLVEANTLGSLLAQDVLPIGDATTRRLEEEFVVPEPVSEPTDCVLLRKKGAPAWRSKDRDWVYKAYPWLFPYVYGFSERIPVREYVGYTLRLGGDRRFQQNSSWYFYWFYEISQTRLSGITAMIQKKQNVRQALRDGCHRADITGNNSRCVVLVYQRQYDVV